MSKKLKTITKKWEIDKPCIELVDDYIKRIRESCANMKTNFPGFVTYKFEISSDILYEYGDEYVVNNIKMVCTRYETDKEEQIRIEANKKRIVTNILKKEAKTTKEKEKMYELMKKYNIKEE